jgi:nitroimidazol reductase NimA-like FMN-containing flavoprotein (pyridoxamine 5'-phosphate oxidase superfamily)
MTTIDAHGHIEIIFHDECLRLLRGQEVGRLGFVSGGSPHILPVNYAMDGEAIVFATNPGGKLWGATHSPVVFEVDETDRATKSGWSVIAHGLAMEVTEFDAVDLTQRVTSLAIKPWATGDRPHLVRIIPTSLTGRRVGTARRAVPGGVSGPR